jgi:hypothetical protein
MMMSSSMVMKKDNFTVLGHCCIIRYMRVHHLTFYAPTNGDKLSELRFEMI